MYSEAAKPLLIAVVDDDPIFRDLTCAILASDGRYKAQPIASGDELFQALKGESIDCILLDYNLGAENGLSIKEKLDLCCSNPPPVVMLTGDGREQTVIEAFRMGVCDYLPKLKMGPETLLSMIAKVVSHEQARLKIKAEHLRLEQAASIDPVTGLSGQTQIEQRLAQLAQLGQEDRLSYTVISLELTQYQSIIEHYGLGAAEHALRVFGEKLKGLQQKDDLCGRYSEGTFLLIKHYRLDPDHGAELCLRLSDFLSFTTETRYATLHLSAKVSITACKPSTPTHIDPWSRLAEPARTLPQLIERGGAVWNSTFDPGNGGVPIDKRHDPRPSRPPQSPAWIYAPT